MIMGTLRATYRGFQAICFIVVGSVFVFSSSNNGRIPHRDSTSDESSRTASVDARPPIHDTLPGSEDKFQGEFKPQDRPNSDEETFAGLAPALPVKKPEQLPSTAAPNRDGLDFAHSTRADEVKGYLWSVYQRSATKMDSRGDFTWKDATAAERLGLRVDEYVIGGMDPDFREQLFAAGQAMDAAGIDWTILSAFRDDYRQSLAAGYKAHAGNSFHGGSIATGGYGHGCAVDLASTDGLSNETVWNWLDQHGRQFGLNRPLRRIDPAHVQPSTGWHELGAVLRKERIGVHSEPVSGTGPDESISRFSASPADDSDGFSQDQYNCVRPRPVVEPNQREEIAHHLNSPTPHSHLSSLVAHISNSNVEKNVRARWRTAGSVAIRRVGLRRSPLDTYNHHGNGREGTALRTKGSAPAAREHNRALSSTHKYAHGQVGFTALA